MMKSLALEWAKFGINVNGIGSGLRPDEPSALAVRGHAPARQSVRATPGFLGGDGRAMMRTARELSRLDHVATTNGNVREGEEEYGVRRVT